MNLGISKNANINYLAKVVNLTEGSFHPFPDDKHDRIKCCTINGFNLICDIKYTAGTYVYFPIMCKINPQFLSATNQFKNTSLNVDPEKSGMFEDSGRVKTIKLAGVRSEGYIIPIEILTNWIVSVTNKEVEFEEGQEFDCVKDGNKEFWIVKKYIIREESAKESHPHGKTKKAKYDRIIPSQFRFHYETVQIKKCPQVIKPDDWIHISTKVHGSSGISARVLCRGVQPSSGSKVGNWIIKKIIDPIFGLKTDSLEEITDYEYIYSSRKVIRSPEFNDTVSPGYYNCNVWKYADDVIRPHLSKGMTVYYEIIGFTPQGEYIQKDAGGYDYGYIIPRHKEYNYNINFGIRVYRVTYTNVDGEVHEFSPREVQIWAKNHNLVPVTELYYGKAKDLYPDLDVNDLNWSENFIDKLSNDSERFYMEVDSPDCNNKVPNEGIVIKVDNCRSEAFKLKSFAFLDKEQKSQDKGEINIEDIS